ncbi:MAG: hypothetical protein WDZ72_10395, partial [Cyclobacteriaceae bacterium]
FREKSGQARFFVGPSLFAHLNVILRFLSNFFLGSVFLNNGFIYVIGRSYQLTLKLTSFLGATKQSP